MQIFSKTLGETDIKRRCAVPMKYFKMKHFPKPKDSHVEDFVVKDECGHDWILCCSTRKVGNDPNHPKHPKPVLVKEWVPFARSKGLRVGDRVIIYEEQDETGSIERRIEVKRQARPPEARSSLVKNPNLGVKKASISNSHGNESTTTFQPFEDPSADVQNRDLCGSDTAATTTFTIDKEQVSTPHSTSQDIACYEMEGPSLELTLKPNSPAGATTLTTSITENEHISTPHITKDIACYEMEGPSLELTLKPTLQGGTTAVTSSRIYKYKTLRSNSQCIACYHTEIPSLNLNLGLTL